VCSQGQAFRLDRGYCGLYMSPMISSELEGFSSGGIGVVLSSQPYREDDYIREYGRFRAQKQANTRGAGASFGDRDHGSTAIRPSGAAIANGIRRSSMVSG